MIIALMFAHKLGLAHSDIKPENIIIYGKQNKLKLIDYGTVVFKANLYGS